MQRDQVLKTLAGHKEELARMGVRSLALFGSTARGDARPDSDVDILVEVDDTQPFGLLALIGLKQHLEKILSCRVDLATPDMLRPQMKDQILREAVRAA